MAESKQYFHIRQAYHSELAELAQIEMSARKSFAPIIDLKDQEYQYPLLSTDLLETFTVYVALYQCVPDHPPNSSQTGGDDFGKLNAAVGYIALRNLDSAVFVAKVAVKHDYQKAGCGTALLEQAITDTQAMHLNTMMSLTTFRDVPWNGPWYVRFGFVGINDNLVEKELGPEHQTVLQKSRAAHGQDGWHWYMMVRYPRSDLASNHVLPKERDLEKI